ncbi:NAD-dependent epimerase/dehydratase family protein [Acidaminobacter sp. JC074]|uniref:NAD-dependent epimerase/dehydratase family protein n=1 Tax=Acidaminobacter sp. JC074 TaxID=2530199 RepID=UPI001F0DB73A|nr:NAD-dependent epimerase/dehydratase family protein [Acidaminobacter sp. JC074]MCH4890981.1 NAD-dependent epimerase/dehydratase family protein [Acidaminobacter sp. JC074]
MTILVLGGSTFVSRSIAEHFINENYQVDIFTRGIKEIPYSGYRNHIRGDRHKPEDLEQLVDKYDYVIDITAYTEMDVRLLLEHLDTSRLKRFIFCSSGAVYCPSKNLIKEDFPLGENHNWRKYGLDKLQAENYLMKAYEKDQLPLVIFRPTYLYGPENALYRESYFFDQLEAGRPIKVPNSQNRTQFIHIHDLCLIVSSMLKNDACIGQAYNVTHEHIYDFNDMLDVFEKVTGKHVERILTDEQPSRKYFPYRDVTYTLSIDKLKEHGLHVPKFDLYEGLKQTYEWYKKTNPKLHDPFMTDI